MDHAGTAITAIMKNSNQPKAFSFILHFLPKNITILADGYAIIKPIL